MPQQFSGKIALITAAGSGIGAATARAFAEAGASLIIADFNRQALTASGEALRQTGAPVVEQLCDCTDEQQVKALVALAVASYGRLDIAVNVVGGALGDAPGPDFHSQSTQGWRDSIALTLDSTYLGMKYQVAQMLENGGGNIVNVSSMAGLSYVPTGGIAYAAAKAAIIHMTKFTASSYGERGVRVNCIAPGITQTPAIDQMVEAHPGYIDAILASQAIKRLIKPSEQAAAILWLCSDAAAMVTGHCLQVDGGWLS